MFCGELSSKQNRFRVSSITPGADERGVMQNVGIGDVIFIILVLGIIHGIMHLVTAARKRKSLTDSDSDNPNS